MRSIMLHGHALLPSSTCLSTDSAQYPQSYLSFLQPANVAFDECRRSPSKPEVAAGCRGSVGNGAPGMGFISTNAGCGQIQRFVSVCVNLYVYKVVRV